MIEKCFFCIIYALVKQTQNNVAEDSTQVLVKYRNSHYICVIILSHFKMYLLDM